MALALIFLLTLGSIWGLSVSTSKLAVQTYGPFAVVFWYALVAFGVLAVISAFRRKLPPLNARHIRYYIASGLIGFAVPSLNNVIVVQQVPAGVLSTMIATAPVFTYAIALAAGQERFAVLRAGGIGLGLVGALVILLPANSLPDAGMAPWVALGLLTPFLYGISAVVISRFMPRETDSIALATGFLGVAVVFFLAAMVASGKTAMPWPPVWPGSHMILWLGVSSSAAYVLYFQIIRMVGPVYLSQVGYLVVSVGVVAGMVIFDERHSLWVWLGIGLMVTGLVFVNIGQIRSARAARRALPIDVGPRNR
jgi:drug/metabolite transporter (DMT)-like permease